MKTAIVYHSKYGTTESVVHLIGERINGEISYIFLREFSNPDIQAYDSVILDTSIYTGNPAKLMVRFYQKNRVLLEQKRIGLYICCMQEESNEIKQMANAYPEWLHQVVIAEMAAGGSFQFNKMNYIEKRHNMRVKSEE